MSDGMINNSETPDSDELEALFDSVVAANQEAEALAHRELATAAPMAIDHPPVSMDKDLDMSLPTSSPAEDVDQTTPKSPPVTPAEQSSIMIDQIGHMTRKLHEALRELGLNKEIEKVATSIPDARDRLNYVATLTQQSAERVLNATEAAQPLVENMEVEAHRLSRQWQMMFDKQMDVEQFKKLASRTHMFLQDVPKQTKATHAYLMEIMMAQDFQDMTGQVIKKIIEITENMEQQLLALLLENAPDKLKNMPNSGLLSGPAIIPGGNKEVANNQQRVDDLLESLGF